MEGNLLVGKLSVDSSKCFKFALHVWLVLAVKENLENSLSVNLYASALSNDFGWVDNVLQDCVLNMCQGTGTRARSLRLGAASKGLAQDDSLRNDNDMTS